MAKSTSSKLDSKSTATGAPGKLASWKRKSDAPEKAVGKTRRKFPALDTSGQCVCSLCEKAPEEKMGSLAISSPTILARGAS
eukprot:6492681-Amphidinium_carterae.2